MDFNLIGKAVFAILFVICISFIIAQIVLDYSYGEKINFKYIVKQIPDSFTWTFAILSIIFYIIIKVFSS